MLLSQYFFIVKKLVNIILFTPAYINATNQRISALKFDFFMNKDEQA